MRIVGRLVFLLILAAAVLAIWIGVRGWLAKDHLQSSAELMDRLQTQVTRGDEKPAQATLKRLQGETLDASNLTNDRVWRGASHLPWFGDDLAAVHTVAVAGHTLSTQALPSLVTSASEVSALQSGGTSLSPAQLLATAHRLQGPLNTANAGVERAQQQVDAVDPAGLVRPLRTAVVQFRSELGRAKAELETVTRADQAVLSAAGHLPNG